MKGIAGRTGYITRTQPFGHTLFLGHISFSDQDLVAFTPSFLHRGSSWRTSTGRPGLRSLKKSSRVNIMVRPLCRAVGTQEHLGRDDEVHLLQERELTQLYWLGALLYPEHTRDMLRKMCRRRFSFFQRRHLRCLCPISE